MRQVDNQRGETSKQRNQVVLIAVVVVLDVSAAVEVGRAQGKYDAKRNR